jgi:uncharacterized phosphosugar-binding protein
MMQYFECLMEVLKQAETKNRTELQLVADMLHDCIQEDGIIYMFGCGHSSLIASDCFYRAGGLANVQPIFIPELMLHISASNSSKLEKNEANCIGVLDGYCFTSADVLFVISVSGINGVPVEVAKMGKEKGLKVVGIGSSAYFDEGSRHSSGQKLAEVCDVFLDNCVPKGDAVISLSNGMDAVPVSTAVSSALIQCCIAESLEKCSKEGVETPVFGCGNLTKNLERNQNLVRKYKDRIRCL